MEENSQTSQKPHPLTALVLMEIACPQRLAKLGLRGGRGILEIGIAIIVFLGIFGTLNYFNILPVSETFPKFLGWLPRQTVKTNDNIYNDFLKQYSSPLPTPTPSPSPTPQGQFQYDAKKAETLLTQYIKDTIKPEFLPEKIEVKEGLTIDGRTENVKYEFGSRFTTNKDLFSVNFHYGENTNNSNDFTIFVQPKTADDATATVSLANSLLASYFTNPLPISSCQTKGTTSYCENFQALNDGKTGYGIIIGREGTKLMTIVFNCIVPKENKDYATQKSCISP